MTANRTPLHRQFRTQITRRALALFRRMTEIECTCDDNSCPGCVEYRALGWELRNELKIKIWEGPVLVWPHWQQPIHPASTGAGEWQRHGGPELFRVLADAAGVEVPGFSKPEKLVTTTK